METPQQPDQPSGEPAGTDGEPDQDAEPTETADTVDKDAERDQAEG